MLYTCYVIYYYFEEKKYIINDDMMVLLISPDYTFLDLDHMRLLTYAPLLLAGWISITRIQDNKHHAYDIIVGALLGIIICHLIFKRLLHQVYSEIKKKLINSSSIQHEYFPNSS